MVKISKKDVSCVKHKFNSVSWDATTAWAKRRKRNNNMKPSAATVLSQANADIRPSATNGNKNSWKMAELLFTQMITTNFRKWTHMLRLVAVGTCWWVVKQLIQQHWNPIWWIYQFSRCRNWINHAFLKWMNKEPVKNQKSKFISTTQSRISINIHLKSSKSETWEDALTRTII